MKTKLAFIKYAALMLLLSTLILRSSTASAQGTAFTYQGNLDDNGSPANGTNYGMVFYLYDAPTNGTLLGNQGIASVSVSNGVFTVPLDFGTNFPGADRWLEITVQKNGGSFSTLAPRQKLNPTPYAITAANVSGSLPAGQLTGTIPATSIAGPYTSAVTLNNPANNFTGVFIGNGAGLTNIPTSGSAWQLTGNAGTTAGVNFLGTTDNQPLEFDVNGTRALRLEPTANIPNYSGIVNVVGGSPANSVVPGTYGATISGGGAANFFGSSPNTVAANFSSISGGALNTIQTGANGAIIGGGNDNTIQTNAYDSIIAGGNGNTIQIDANRCVISGGTLNTIQTNTQNCTIGGGFYNAIQNQGSFANVASTIAGGYSNIIQYGSGQSTIGGGTANLIQANTLNSTIGGGNANAIQTDAGTSTIGGGRNNTIQGNDSVPSPFLDSTISGGDGNTIQSNAPSSTIGGGGGNTIQTNTVSAFIGGGSGNTIQSRTDTQIDSSVIVGGFQNTIQTNAHLSFIGGGYGNTIQADAHGAVIDGGELNSNQAGGSTIAGGTRNEIQINAFNSVIGGGNNNTIMGNGGGPGATGTIGGGAGNIIQFNSFLSTISGGQVNTIQTGVSYSTISGGSSNTAAGNFATVPGGDQNIAGTNSFAAGHRAKATNTGTFVWADSTDVDFASTADNQFLIRASGGVGIGANNPDATLTVNGTADKPGGGAWTVFSDARLKKNIEPLTGALNRLLELRAVTFEYKDPQSIHELPGVQIGMIAQEVEKIFPDWVDTAPNGMKRLSIHGFEALTVQSLRELRAEKDAKISDLEKSNAEMQKQLAAQKELNSQMAARFEALEKTVGHLADQSPVPLAATEQAAK